jgi:preprotein translocase subunit SecB
MIMANEEVHFLINRVYVKDSSFETHDTPACFERSWEPELSLDLNTQTIQLENGVYEVILTVTATVTNQKTNVFLAEVKQAGIFSIKGAVSEQLDHLLGSFCPSILYPYAREAITALVVRGSFPQLVLAPVNFDAFYMQQMEEKQKAKVENETETETETPQTH